MTHKRKIMPATSPLLCNPLPSKTHTNANIDATFSNVQCFKVYSKQFSNTYSILAYLFTAMLCDYTIITSYLFMHNVFCFDGFNSFTWCYMGRITKDNRCLIKKWLKSGHIYGSHRKIKTGVPLFWNTL